MSKFAKFMLVLCLGLVGMSQAFAQDEEAVDTNVVENAIEVPTTDSQVMEAPSSESPELERLMYVSIGQVQVPKVVVQQFNFRPDSRREAVYAIRLVASQNIVDVQRAEIVLRNGQVFSLNRLNGFLQPGRSRRVFLSQFGVRIRSIRIWATSPNLVGSRGNLQVDVLVNR